MPPAQATCQADDAPCVWCSDKGAVRPAHEEGVGPGVDERVRHRVVPLDEVRRSPVGASDLDDLAGVVSAVRLCAAYDDPVPYFCVHGAPPTLRLPIATSPCSATRHPKVSTRSDPRSPEPGGWCGGLWSDRSPHSASGWSEARPFGPSARWAKVSLLLCNGSIYTVRAVSPIHNHARWSALMSR